MFLVIAVLVLIVLLTFSVKSSVFETWCFLKKVKKLPTTKQHPIFGHLLDIIRNRTKLVEFIVKNMEQQHDMFTAWLGPVPVLIITSPRLHELILGSSKHLKKANQYKFLEPWLGTGLLLSTGAKWHSHRKLLTPTFHFKILENFVDVFAEKSQLLVKIFEEKLGPEDLDVFPYISRCTLDIICETAMGVNINAQDVNQKSDYITAVCKITDEIFSRIVSPWLYPDFIFKLTPSGKRLQKYIDTVHGFTNQVIRMRKAVFKQKNNNIKKMDDSLGIKKKLAFLDLLLEVSQDGKILTDEEIREEVDTFMFEGHDTTSAGIAWTLLLLGQHPKIQDYVYEELESIFQSSDRAPTIKDLNEMKYLERVIKEGLRCYPSVPVIGRVLQEDVHFDGHVIPAGMFVAHVVCATHYLPKYFEDNFGFNPDHFLPEKIAERHPYAYIPFSAGPRNCIGQKFALLEEKTIISYIIRNFKFEAVGEEPEPLMELIVRPETGIHLKFAKRVRSC